MTSYQKRKGDIRYLTQCVNELDVIGVGLMRCIKRNKIKDPLLLGKGMAGDDFITPYNNGEFIRKLIAL